MGDRQDGPGGLAPPPLTRDRIVTEAVAPLDEDETMRRLAERLGAFLAINP